MLHVLDARIKEPLHYAEIITVPQSKARKQGASFTLLHTGSPPSDQSHDGSWAFCLGNRSPKKSTPEAGVSRHAPVCAEV